MEDTRRKLIRAAERLMAERGVDNVTFAQITRAAGQRNNSAVPYHFGDRRGLIGAVLEVHTTPIAARRAELLDALGPDPTLRELVEAFIAPIAEEVAHAEGGEHFVRLMSQLQSHPEIDPLDFIADHLPVTERITALLEQAAPLDREVLQVRVDLALTLVFHGLADRVGSGAIEPNRAFFVENLIDVVEATLCIPASSRTERLRDTVTIEARPLGRRLPA